MAEAAVGELADIKDGIKTTVTTFLIFIPLMTLNDLKILDLFLDSD